MPTRGSERLTRLRMVVCLLLDKKELSVGGKVGTQNRLAKHFGVSRQRVNQVVIEERLKRELAYLRSSGELQEQTVEDWVETLHQSYRLKRRTVYILVAREFGEKLKTKKEEMLVQAS